MLGLLSLHVNAVKIIKTALFGVFVGDRKKTCRYYDLHLTHFRTFSTKTRWPNPKFPSFLFLCCASCVAWTSFLPALLPAFVRSRFNRSVRSDQMLRHHRSVTKLPTTQTDDVNKGLNGFKPDVYDMSGHAFPKRV